ncbi:hypothetical protein ACQEV4_37480 [Streptomyces shenzhenensis]|uniref:hypothetical protein n=1 Tax=Streptomyces shenzhenensis TaxID=943815 RepID=UPI003D8B2E75
MRRMAGGWAQRPGGEIAWRILAGGVGSGVGRAARAAIAREAERLRSRPGAARVAPRFRAPSEREPAV